MFCCSFKKMPGCFVMLFKHAFTPKGSFKWNTLFYSFNEHAGKVHVIVNAVGGFPCERITVNNFTLLIAVFMYYLFIRW